MNDLHAQIEELEKKVAERSRELRQARDAADAANQARNAFIARMSHEIRTPLNGVIGMVDLLAGTELDESQRHYLQIARQSGEALLTVVNDMLDSSKIEAGRTESIAASAEQCGKLGRVLLVEDNEVNQFIARRVLEAKQYECDVAGTGKEAIEAITLGHYDLVLMDCGLPDMSGYDATRRIREMEGASAGRLRLPIVALTAESDGACRQECIAAGMDDFCTKPINPAELFDILRRLVRRSDRTAPRAPGIVEMIARPTPEPAEPAPAPGGPALDVQALLNRSLGDVDFAQETLDQFKDRIVADLETLRKSVEGKTGSETVRVAHGLKGVAGHLGAVDLRSVAARLEALGATDQAAQIDACLQDLKREIDRCVTEIPQARQELTTCNRGAARALGQGRT